MVNGPLQELHIQRDLFLFIRNRKIHRGAYIIHNIQHRPIEAITALVNVALLREHEFDQLGKNQAGFQ
jgi:hypothetical protein